jgi:hypothetical protein
VLGTPHARASLGVELVGHELRILPDDRLALAKLKEVVYDVVHNKVDSRKLGSSEQRAAYASEVASRDLKAITPKHGKGGTVASPTADRTSGRGRVRRIPIQRERLIPGACKLKIANPRTNRIYGELQDLKLPKFLNCGAVLLRVFVEFSVNDYAAAHAIPIKVRPKQKPGKGIPQEREMYLPEKIRATVEHLSAKGICDKHQLKGIRAALSEVDNPLSVRSLQDLVHNAHFNPTLRILTTMWDNIEPFMIGLWTR